MPSRVGSKRAFRYLDAGDRVIRDAAVLERIEGLAIPPAWKDVWISSRPHAKLQATGIDKAGGGPRVFKYRWKGDLYNLTSKRLNDYVKIYLGEEFSAKDFRTWGGTLLAAIYFAESVERQGFPESVGAQKRSVTAVMQRVAKRLGNTPAVCRSSYVSPAVVEQYLDGRTIDDFRPRNLRVVKARDPALSREEKAMLSLLHSTRIRRTREAE